jgi:5-methylcytosine-specific restriction endonuclease McrA
MTEPVSIGSVVRALYPTCPHEHTEVRYKIFANGTKHLCTQCLTCGQKTDGTRWLGQKGIDMAEVHPFDELLADAYAQRENAARRGRLRKEKLERHLEYERYIRDSDDWWEIRTKVMRRDNNWCQACWDAPATEVHHKSYEQLYREILWELEAVCSACHRKIHGLIEHNPELQDEFTTRDLLARADKMIREPGEGD